MKATELITLTTLAALTLNMSAKDFSAEELQQRMVERRAVDAAIRGMPIVSLDAMRQAYFRDGKAKYGDIIWWPKRNNWKNQSLTPNTSLRYLYIFLNTKDDGPVVLDLPPVDSRGIAFSTFFLPPAKLGKGSFYLGANFDSSGQPLRGETLIDYTFPRMFP